jgi:hypothetical protein
MAGNVADKRQSGKFRHSVFISDTFDFLNEFEDENGDTDIGCKNKFGTKHCGPEVKDFDSDYARGAEVTDQIFSVNDDCVYAPGTKGGILNKQGTLQSVTNIESNLSAAVNRNESHAIVPNGNQPNEDRTGGHIDYSTPGRLTNAVNGADTVDDGANQISCPAKEFFENRQNGAAPSFNKTCSGLIKDSSMPGCHGNGGVGDELGMGTLTEGKTNGVAIHSCGLRADVRSDAQGTMCAENMDGLCEDSKEKCPHADGKCPNLTKSVTDSETKDLSRSLSSQDKHVLTNGNNECDRSSKKIPGSVSMPSNLECSRGSTVADDVTTKSDDVTTKSDDVATKSDDVIEESAKYDDVIDSADQNCDGKFKGDVSPTNCDTKNGCTGGVVKNGVHVNGSVKGGLVENVESNGQKRDTVLNAELNGTKSITADDLNSEDSGSMKQSVDSDLESEVKVVLRRSAANSPSRFSESSSRGTSEDEDDDEDAGK